MEQQKSIDRALLVSRLQALRTDLRAAGWLIALIVIAFVLAGYWFASPREAVGSTRAVATGMHQRQSETGRGALQLSVVLENGQSAIVTLPPHELYRAGATVEVEVLRREWPPHWFTYRFVRYVENPVRQVNESALGGCLPLSTRRHEHGCNHRLA